MEVVLLSIPMIDRMLADPQFEAFDCLKNPVKLPVSRPAPPRACSGCSKPRPVTPPAPQIDYNSIKLCIYNLDAAQKLQLREKIARERVIMQFKAHDGTMRKDEF